MHKYLRLTIILLMIAGKVFYSLPPLYAEETTETALYQKALELFFGQSYQEADLLLEQLTQKEDSGRALFWRTLIALEENNYQHAKNWAGQAAKQAGKPYKNLAQVIDRTLNKKAKHSLRPAEQLLQARLAFLNKNYARAAALYEAALYNNISSDYVLYQQSVCYERLNMADESRNREEALIRLYPQSPYVPAVFLNRASKAGRNSEQELLRLIDRYKNGPAIEEARRRLGNFYVKNRNKEGLEQLLTATENERNRRIFSYNLALMLLPAESRRAETLLKYAAAGNETTVSEQAAYRLARLYYEEGRFGEAAAALQQTAFTEKYRINREILSIAILKKQQNYERMLTRSQAVISSTMLSTADNTVKAVVYLQRAYAFIQTKQESAALTDLATVLRLTPEGRTAREALYYQGLIYSRRHEAVRARAYFNRAARQEADSRERYTLLFAQAAAAAETGRYDEAGELAMQLRTAAHNNDTAWKQLIARIKSRQGYYNDAAVLYNAIGLSDGSDTAESFYLAALHFYKAGNFNSAVKAFLMLITHKNNYTAQPVFYWLGRSYEGLGRWEAAQEAYRRQLDNMPDNAEIKNRLTEIVYAAYINNLYLSDDPKTADKLAAYFTKVPYATGRQAYQLAEQAQNSGKTDQAIIFFHFTAQNNRSLAGRALYKKAALLEKKGDPASALQSYAEAVINAANQEEYIKARYARSRIYVNAGQFDRAVYELMLVAEAFDTDEKAASEALYAAYKICREYTLTVQAEQLKRNLLQRYPEQADKMDLTD
jgi:tetratricopeptide (TPR) repeat protein